MAWEETRQEIFDLTRDKWKGSRGSYKKQKKNMESFWKAFPSRDQFIYKLLLSKSNLNVFVWWQALTDLCFFLMDLQQLLPPSHH